MEYHKILELVRNESRKHMNDSFLTIMKLCNDDVNIKHFVEIALNKEHELNSYLTSLIWQCGYNIRIPSSNVLDKLKSFLINYFYDDLEVYFEKDNFGFWVIKSDYQYACLSSPKEFINLHKKTTNPLG